MAEVANADKVTVVRPIDLPKGSYNPKYVVTIDTGDRNKPLEKLELDELMPKTDGVSVLKGNCGDTPIYPDDNGPMDFDCNEVEKSGDDLWVASDKRLHAKAGWYHLDMGVYIGLVDLESPSDERTMVYFGAYVGDAPDAEFDYKDYGAVDFNLSYDHEITQSVGVDVHVEHDGDVIHLAAATPAGITATCYLDWFSIHRIAEVVVDSSGGGGGDTPSGDCNVHVIDLRLLEDAGPLIWDECIDALIDGKLLFIRVNVGENADYTGFTCMCEQSLFVPEGYTKDEYKEYLRNSMYSNLTFYGTYSIAGTLLIEGVKFTVSASVGLQLKYEYVTWTGGISIIGTDVTGEFGSGDVVCVDYTDPDNPTFTQEPNLLIDALSDLQVRGLPLFLMCRNSTRQFYIEGYARMTGYGRIELETHTIATYYEDPDDSIRSEKIPVDYHVQLTWNDDLSYTLGGYYTIYTDNVYPLALDSRFNGPI